MAPLDDASSSPEFKNGTISLSSTSPVEAPSPPSGVAEVSAPHPEKTGGEKGSEHHLEKLEQEQLAQTGGEDFKAWWGGLLKPEPSELQNAEKDIKSDVWREKDGLPTREKAFAKRLKELLDENGDVGDIHSQHPLAQKHRRELTPAEVQKFKKLNGKQKEQELKAWAKDKVKEYLVERVEIKTWRTLESSKIEFMSATMVWRREGGTVDDVPAACNRISKCLALGWPFVRWNEWSGRHDFGFVSETLAEEFEAVSQRKQKEIVDTSEVAEPEQVLPKPEPKGKRKRNQDDADAGTAAANKTKKAKAGTESPDKAGTAAANKTKKAIQAAVSESEQLILMAQKSKEWRWLDKDPSSLQQLKAQKQAFEDNLDDFSREVLSGETFAELKKTHEKSYDKKLHKFSCLDVSSLENAMALMRELREIWKKHSK